VPVGLHVDSFTFEYNVGKYICYPLETFSIHFVDRQTNRQTDRQTDIKALLYPCCACMHRVTRGALYLPWACAVLHVHYGINDIMWAIINSFLVKLESSTKCKLLKL